MRTGSYTNTSDVLEFLRHSNNIEGVCDDDSLMQAWYAWEYCMAQKEIIPATILKTHKILMLNQPLQPNEIGYFRKVPVWIGGKEATPWDQLKPGIISWLHAMHDEDSKHDYVWAHVLYERVHPFLDGNGRTGRIFMNFHRRSIGEPLLIIEESDRQEYYQWFRDSDLSSG